MDASKLLAGIRVVPVVVIDDVDQAVPLARCLVDAGLTAIEVTLRTEAGVKAIESIATEVPDMLVGAGSVRDAGQVDAVIAAGAKFGVSPGSSQTLLDAVDAANFPFIPGAVSPTETLELRERGYTLQKFFPAEIAGGAAYIRAVGGPIPDVSFMPTGGVNPDNVQTYLKLTNVACVGGTWIAPSDLLASEDFETIGERARVAANLE